MAKVYVVFEMYLLYFRHQQYSIYPFHSYSNKTYHQLTGPARPEPLFVYYQQ